MRANNQNEWTMRDEFLFLSVVAIITVVVVITVLTTLTLYANPASASQALPLYLAFIIISFALIFYIDRYIDRKVTVHEGGGK